MNSQATIEIPFQFGIDEEISYPSIPKSTTNPEILRRQEILTRFAEMGLNSFLVEHLIEQENINIYEGDLPHVFNILLERVFNAESEINVEGAVTNIHVNSFTQMAHSQGPKLTVSGGELFECLICTASKSEILMQPEEHLDCREHRFCAECISTYLQHQIKTSNVERIPCPYEGCRIEYSEEYIKSVVTASVFNNYKRFKLIKQVSKEPNARWCPRPGCQGYVIGPPEGGGSRLTCVCRQEICFDCGYEYHHSQKCEDALDKTYRKALKQFIIQFCPKCRAPIQKSTGCNHMSCVKCGHQFCWLCRRKYNSNHYKRYRLNSCHGSQFANLSPARFPFVYLALLLLPRIIYWILRSISAVIRFILYFVFVLIAKGFMLPTLIAETKSTKIKTLLNNKQPRKLFLTARLSLMFVGVLFLPISVLFYIVPGSCLILLGRL